MSTWTGLVNDEKVLALMIYCLVAGVILGVLITWDVAYKEGFDYSDELNVEAVESFFVCFDYECVRDCECFDTECFEDWLNGHW